MKENNAYTVSFSEIREGIDIVDHGQLGRTLLVGMADHQGSTYVPLHSGVASDTQSMLYRGVLRFNPAADNESSSGYEVILPQRGRKSATLLLRLSTSEFPGSRIVPMGNNRKRKPLNVKSTYHLRGIEKRNGVWTEALHNLEQGQALQFNGGDADNRDQIPGFVIFNNNGEIIRKGLAEARAIIEATRKIRSL